MGMTFQERKERAVIGWAGRHEAVLALADHPHEPEKAVLTILTDPLNAVRNPGVIEHCADFILRINGFDLSLHIGGRVKHLQARFIEQDEDHEAGLTI